jgi:hypothetical protein
VVGRILRYRSRTMFIRAALEHTKVPEHPQLRRRHRLNYSILSGRTRSRGQCIDRINVVVTCCMGLVNDDTQTKTCSNNMHPKIPFLSRGFRHLESGVWEPRNVIVISDFESSTMPARSAVLVHTTERSSNIISCPTVQMIQKHQPL